MNAYKKYVTIDNFQQLVLGNLPFKPGQKVEVIILTEYDQETELKQSDCILLENIEDEPFVGMWKDREDLKDSSQWVRHFSYQLPVTSYQLLLLLAAGRFHSREATG